MQQVEAHELELVEGGLLFLPLLYVGACFIAGVVVGYKYL
jgi:hypothetical protein